MSETISSRFINELQHEAQKTRRMLERVPEEKLSWRPHPKSMSLGELALHIARLPYAIAELVTPSEVEPPNVPRPQAKSVAELLSALDAGVVHAIAKLAAWSDSDMQATWTMKSGGAAVLQLQRRDVIRAIMMNHSYHHRGQLSVYLRLLDVPLPSTFGPSADEARFG